MKEWAKQNQLVLRQISMKNRNPNNAPLPDELSILESFENNPNQRVTIKRSVFKSETGRMIYLRIPVTESCFACHGDKDSRPDFVKEKYPEDKAYDFKVNDLRGVYALFLREDVKLSSLRYNNY